MTEQMDRIWDKSEGIDYGVIISNKSTDGRQFSVTKFERGAIIIASTIWREGAAMTTSIHTSKEGAEQLADLLAQATGNALYITDVDADSEVTP